MKSRILFLLIILISYSCSLNKYGNIPVRNEIDLSFKSFSEIKKEEMDKESKDITVLADEYRM